MQEEADFTLHAIVYVGVYGGHERMLVQWLTSLRPLVKVWAPLDSEFVAAAKEAGLECKEAGFRTVAPLSRTDHIHNAIQTWRLVRRLPQHCVVLLAPGVIQAGLSHLLSALVARRPVLSYVPMAPSSKVLGASHPGLRDAFTKALSRHVSAWVTVTPEQQRQLRERWAVRTPIVVLPNLLPGTTTQNHVSRLSAVSVDREEGERILCVGFAGRFEAQQKGLDWLVSAISEEPELSNGVRWIFQGRGDFEPALRKLSARMAPNTVKVRPWGDVAAMFAEIDMLVLPSRFEGFPLIAVDAIDHGLPVVASHTAGLGDVLPPSCIFTLGDRAGLLRSLTALRDPTERAVAVFAAKENLARIHTREAFDASLAEIRLIAASIAVGRSEG